MSTYHELLNKQPKLPALENIGVVNRLIVVGIVLLALGLLSIQSATGLSPPQAINNLLGLDSIHIWWYITRALV